jgi:hypothetical protein
MLLDGHFVIEHTARNRSGRHFNFNGTGGVWRRSTIADAGGWQHDTLTEDLDLSYRAQIRGWKFVYLKEVTAPGELPGEMTAFKAQQHRWAKGSIQTGLKILPTIWRSDLPLKVKSEATPPDGERLLPADARHAADAAGAAGAAAEPGRLSSELFDWSVFVLATVGALVLRRAQRDVDAQRRRYLPAVLALGIGLAVNNARAVIEALCSYETPFVRTPKYAVKDGEHAKPSHRYKSLVGLMPLVEIAFGLYMSAIVWIGAMHGIWMVVVFISLFAFGFFYVGIGSLMNRRGPVRPILPLPAPAP